MHKLVFAFTLLSSSILAKERIFFISHSGAGDAFWSVAYQGVKQSGIDFGADVHFMAPETPNDISRQVEILDAAIASKPDAIAMSIPNDLSFSRSLKKAQALKIPIVAVNSRPSLEDRTKNPYLSFIGMDDYEAGRKIAEKAYSSGRITERAVIANHQPGHSGLENRLKGIEDVLKTKQVIVDKLDISADASAITSILESHLNRYPKLSTIFCLGPQCVHGIGRYFREKKRQIFLVSFDITPFTLQLIKEDIVSFSIDQEPFQQGYQGVAQVISLLRENKAPKDLDTGANFITKENVDSVFALAKKGLR